MKRLRQLHLYLGCLFAPMTLYFALSGAWQLFRLNDVPRGETPSAVRAALHELSKPHTHSTWPSRNPREAESAVFTWFALAAALGLATTALLGLLLAVRFGKSLVLVATVTAAGVVLPILFLLGR